MIILLPLLAACAGSANNDSAEYTSGYDAGCTDGETEGYDEGYAAGLACEQLADTKCGMSHYGEGWSAGYAMCFDEARTEGWSAGWAEGGCQ